MITIRGVAAVLAAATAFYAGVIVTNHYNTEPWCIMRPAHVNYAWPSYRYKEWDFMPMSDNVKDRRFQ